MIGRLCESTKLTHTEIDQMPAWEVERLLLMNETRIAYWESVEQQRQKRAQAGG